MCVCVYIYIYILQVPNARWKKAQAFNAALDLPKDVLNETVAETRKYLMARFHSSSSPPPPPPPFLPTPPTPPRFPPLPPPPSSSVREGEGGVKKGKGRSS